jgi:hypothetical protein
MNSTTSKVGKITRREFVKGTGTVGLVIGAGGAALLEPAHSMPQQASQGKTIREPARDVKVIREADVVVGGGGPGGVGEGGDRFHRGRRFPALRRGQVRYPDRSQDENFGPSHVLLGSEC